MKERLMLLAALCLLLFRGTLRAEDLGDVSDLKPGRLPEPLPSSGTVVDLQVGYGVATWKNPPALHQWPVTEQLELAFNLDIRARVAFYSRFNFALDSSWAAPVDAYRAQYQLGIRFQWTPRWGIDGVVLREWTTLVPQEGVTLSPLVVPHHRVQLAGLGVQLSPRTRPLLGPLAWRPVFGSRLVGGAVDAEEFFGSVVGPEVYGMLLVGDDRHFNLVLKGGLRYLAGGANFDETAAFGTASLAGRLGPTRPARALR